MHYSPNTFRNHVMAAALCLAAVISAQSAQPVLTSIVRVTGGQIYNAFPEVTNAVAIAAGTDAGLALTEDGRVLPLRMFDSPITSALPTGLSNVVVISAGDSHGFALRADGTVASWNGGVFETNTPAGLTQFVSIDCGWGSNLGLLSDGRVALWGFWFVDTNYPAELTNVVDVSAGHRHFAALRGDGTVISWGYTNMGATLVPQGLSNVTAISCGAYHTLALRRDGGVVAWGQNSGGATTVPAEATNIISIAAGYYNNLALRRDNHLVCWGGGSNYVIEVSNVVAMAAGLNYSLALIRSDGPFVAPGMIAPQIQDGFFKFGVPAFRGRRYFIERSADPLNGSWSTLPAVAGIGSNQQFSIPSQTNTHDFFRVRCQP